MCSVRAGLRGSASKNVPVCGQGGKEGKQEHAGVRAGQHKEPKGGRRRDEGGRWPKRPRPRAKQGNSGGGSRSGRRGRERRKGVTLAALVGRKGEGRETGEAPHRSTGDEGTPRADPRLSGRRVGHPGIVGGVNDVLLPPSTSESRTSSELEEMVDAGDSAGRVWTRIRRV